MIDNPKYVPEVKGLQKELEHLMQASGFTQQTDHMPIDDGIKKELPDQKIQ